MLRMKRTRYPKLNLLARYRCPACKRATTFRVAVRPASDRDPTARLFGRPSEVICFPGCDTRLEYEGLRRA